MYKRVPSHIGIIPDGNRRWALGKGMEKKDGYGHGIGPGLEVYELMLENGVKEATFYGFTRDNNKRPVAQREAFTRACVESVELLRGKDANILVCGNDKTPAFPQELKDCANKRVQYGSGAININFLINYDWEWDLKMALETGHIASKDIARIDMIIRWGGRRRLSGFLPVQSVYADFYVVEDMWPDYKPEQFHGAMAWYQDCDVTLGG